MGLRRPTIDIEVGVHKIAPAPYFGIFLLQLPELTVALGYGLISYALVGCLIVALKRADAVLAQVEVT